MPEFLKEYGTTLSVFGFPTTDKLAKQLEEDLAKDDELVKFSINKSGFEYCIAGERSDVSVITDNSIDEDGEVMDIKSLDFSPLRENGSIVAYNHNYNAPPLGKSLWQKIVKDSIKAKTQYATPPDNKTEFFPETIFQLVKQGFLPGKSIGGTAKFRKFTEEEIAAKPELKNAKGLRYNGKVYEYSVVPFRANKNAVVEVVSKSVLTIKDWQASPLHNDFPELEEIIKSIKAENTPILIKGHISLADYNKKIGDEVVKQVGDLTSKLPEMMEDSLARLLGKV